MGLFNNLKNMFNKKDNLDIQEKYDKGLEKTRSEFVSKLNVLGIKYNKVNDEYFDELEQLLIMADIGVQTVFKFMERLVLHVPDKGFQQIRYYGFYSNKFKNKIDDCSLFSKKQLKEMKYNTKWLVALEKSFGYNPTLCKCGNYMILDYELSVFKEGNSP